MECVDLFFCLKNRLYTTVLSFGSHICNQAARIRVKGTRISKGDTRRLNWFYSHPHSYDRSHDTFPLSKSFSSTCIAGTLY